MSFNLINYKFTPWHGKCSLPSTQEARARPLLSGAGLPAGFDKLLPREASFDPEVFYDRIYHFSILGVPF
jgi:hypothetical protein